MGWNDRLPEDPFIPYENETDRDNYEAWHEYLIYLAAQSEAALQAEGAGLTSQNIDPVCLSRDVQDQPNASRQEKHHAGEKEKEAQRESQAEIPADNLGQT